MRIFQKFWTIFVMGVFLASCSLFEKDPMPVFTVPENVLTGYSTPQYDLPQYNIILILTDDQRYDTLQYMPNVQELLVEQGINFTNAFATTPHCAPSRANILTGMYAYNNGVLKNNEPYGGFFAFDDSFSVNLWLQDAGYTTGLLGKYFNKYNFNRNNGYVPPGWDFWAPNGSKASDAFAGGTFYNYQIFNNGEVVFYGQSPEEYGPDVIAEMATEFIEENSGENPFFLYLPLQAPHYPAIAAPRHEGYYDDIEPWRPKSFNKPLNELDKHLTQEEKAENDAFRIDQLNSLLAMDDVVATVVAALEENEELENTMIIFCSDHGYLWGEHALAMEKYTFYDESLRVPFVVRFPGLTDAPRVVDEFVLLVDLAPTFTEIAGLGTPNGVDGESFLPIIVGEGENWREEFIFELWYGTEPIVTKGLITPEWKLVALHSGRNILFNRLEDPFEMRDLANQREYADLIEELLKQLEYLWDKNK